MRRLFELIIKYRNFLTFLFLEGISIFFIVQYNLEQRQILFSSASLYSGKLYNVYAGLNDYLDLRQDNERLLEENRLLRERLQIELGTDVLQIDTFYNDTMSPEYSFIAAKIIKNSIASRDNMIALNKGRKHGVRERMGIVGQKGIVGIVVGVSENYSLGMSILHRQARISASLKSNDYFGSLVWKDENEPTIMNLEDIPKHAKIEVGDTVQTSGYSAIFPPGITIGTVLQDSMLPGNNFFNIKVKLLNDISNAQYVYVVDYIAKYKLDELESKKY